MLNQERELGQLQRSLEEARLEAAEEGRRREEAASEVKQLEAEVRRLQLEAEQLRRGPEEEPGVERLREHNEKLTAENFEYAVENVSNNSYHRYFTGVNVDMIMILVHTWC